MDARARRPDCLPCPHRILSHGGNYLQTVSGSHVRPSGLSSDTHRAGCSGNLQAYVRRVGYTPSSSHGRASCYGMTRQVQG
jgi:hypothetical protein